MEKDFITVKTFTFPADVAIVQSYMEMQGIKVFMKNMVSNQLSYPFGDIEMQVKSTDYEIAKRALIEGGFAQVNDFEI